MDRINHEKYYFQNLWTRFLKEKIPFPERPNYFFVIGKNSKNSRKFFVKRD